MDLRARALAAAEAGETTAELAGRFAARPARGRRLQRRHRGTGEVAPREARDPRVPEPRPHPDRTRERLPATPDVTLAEPRGELRVTVAPAALRAAVRGPGVAFKERRPGGRAGPAGRAGGTGRLAAGGGPGPGPAPGGARR